MKTPKLIVAIVLFITCFQVNLYAGEITELKPPILDPNEVVEISWKYIVDKGMDIEQFEYRIELVFYSYTRRQWNVFFDGKVPLGGHFHLNIEDRSNPEIRFVGGA